MDPRRPPTWLAAARADLLRSLPVGYVIHDGQLRYLEVNRVLAEINGRPAADHVGRTIEQVAPNLADVLVRRLRYVLETCRPLREVEMTGTVASSPGRQRHWLQSIYPVQGVDGAPVGVVSLVREITELRSSRRRASAREVAEASARRLHLLQQLTAALATAVDTVQVAEAITSTATAAFGAGFGALTAIDANGRCRTLAASAPPDPTGERRQTDAVGAALRARRPVLVCSARELRQQHPELAQMAGVPAGHEAVAVLPLLVDDAPIGLLTFAWQRRRRFAPEEIELLAALAAQTATAMGRATLYEAERAALAAARRAQRRLALLGEVSAKLATARTEAEQLAWLAELLVDGFADQCAILMPDEQQRLYRAASRCTIAEHQPLAAAITGTPVPSLPDDDPRAMAWFTGSTTAATAIDPHRYLSGIDPAVADQIAAHFRGGSIIAAPLVAGGQRLGVFSVWRFAHHAPFDSDDLRALTDIGRRAGTAVDNLRLLAASDRAATRLQATLLPDRLPDIAGVELAATYLPAEDAADVGGDLYDAFPVGDGSYALIIGDVAGRGVAAAGLTGLTRATLRALAGQLPVDTALARLNTLLAERTGGSRFLTLAYLLLRPTPHGAQVEVWLAGHHRPLLVHADGTVSEIGDYGSLLGLLPEVHHTAACHRLAPGDLLVLCTDGLTEARGPDGMFGTARLPSLLAGLAGHTAREAVARLERAVREYRCGSADDAALLVARLAPAGPDADPGAPDRQGRGAS